MKIGKVNVIRANAGMYSGEYDAEITVENIGGRNYTTFTVVRDTAQPSEPPHALNTYRSLNIEKNEEHLLALLSIRAPWGIASYKWLEPLTEVPSQGGGSGLTIDDVYPVGIEITTTDTTFNPMKVWGGTWTVSPAGAKRVWTRTA